MYRRYASNVLGVVAALLCLSAAPSKSVQTSILHYTVRLRGVSLLAADFCFRLDAHFYDMAVLGRTLGLVNTLMHGRAEIHAQGAVDAADRVLPHAYTERSRLSGADYAVTIDYPGRDPVLRAEIPPQEKYRLPIPPSAVVGAIDGVSEVMVQSLAAARGVCAGETHVYDGRQVRALSLHDGVVDRLPPNSNSVFQGAALRCETESTMLAGFVKDEPVASQTKPMRGRLWLASAPEGGPAVPVRMVFDAGFWGDVVVQLDGASRAGAEGCQGAGWAGEEPR